MKAIAIIEPGIAKLIDVPEMQPLAGEVPLRVRMIGLCGSDLNTFRGKNAMVRYPRILGHEVAATTERSSVGFTDGTDVTLSPYTACGRCPSCTSCSSGKLGNPPLRAERARHSRFTQRASSRLRRCNPNA